MADDEYQVELRPMALDWPTVRSPPAPPPLCACHAPCVWSRHRWWCANEEDGCGFESEVPPAPPHAPPPLTPLCKCSKPCKWLLDRWWCARYPTGGCDFELRPDAHAQPTRVVDGATRHPPPESDVVAVAQGCAAMLTASAYGLEDWCFVAPSDCGLGLFARSALRKGQRICEYSGPHLPLELLVRGECAPLLPRPRELMEAAPRDGDGPAAAALPPRPLSQCNSRSNPIASRRAAPPQTLSRFRIVALSSMGRTRTVRTRVCNPVHPTPPPSTPTTQRIRMRASSISLQPPTSPIASCS